MRLVFVFKLEIKKQQNASKLSFEKQENKDFAGIFLIIIVVILGLLVFG